MPNSPSPIFLSEADAPAVARLFARCVDYFLLQDGVAPTVADAHELFTDVPPGRGADEQTVMGWEGDDGLDAIVAILRDYPDEGIWYLGLMMVGADQRGRGRGRSIYATIAALARTGGADEIRLAVLEANEAGERFWRSLGFEEIRRVGPDGFKARSHRRIELRRHIDGDCNKATGNWQ